MRGFSFASVVLSYLLVAGGLFTGMLALRYVHVSNEYMGYLMLAAGAFAGGFVAARASRGSTIVEPAIGGLAVVATIVFLFAGTEVGKMLWAQAHDQTVKAIAMLSVSTAVGAIGGAYIGETFFGEATISTGPWFVYSAFATFGACLLVTLIASILVAGNHPEGDVGSAAEAVVKMLFVGLAVGCFVAGITIGASARVRPLLASFIGGGAGVAGFGLLVSSTSEKRDSDMITGIVVLAVGGAIVTLIGALIGWAVAGKRQATAG